MTASRKEVHSSYADFSDDSEPEAVTEEVASSLKELLTTKRIPLLTSREQFRLADIIECIGMVEKHRRSIDDNAGRFLLFFRQHVLSETHKGPISWREIIWAFHSGSQDILVDLVSRHFSGKMMWQHAKECGVFMWMSDVNALVWYTLPCRYKMLTVSTARSIRGHCSKRVHEDRRKEPRRLRPILHGPPEEAGSSGSLANGYLVERTGRNTSTIVE